MGIGQFGGNGSVKWKVLHEKKIADGGAPSTLTYVDAPTSLTADRVYVGSHAEGHDPIPFDEIGVTKGAPPGHFRVSIQYPTRADAVAAKEDVKVHGSSLVLFVRAIDRTGGQNENVPKEIRVEW